MKANAPEKIYVQLPSRNWIGRTWNETPIKEGDNPNWKNATNIEYTRIDAINNLEVKDVDLEKEISEYIDDEWCDEYSSDVGNWIRYRRGTTSMKVEDVKYIAKHFFELGMQVNNKAQKGE